jgi:regulator of protease activity HflC (stomatin/prohibitin superfamily)
MNMTNARKLPASRGGLVGVFSLAAAALIAVIALILLFMAWRTIEPGYVGIVFDKASHRVSNTADPGWTFVNPFTESITKYPVSLQTLTMVQNNPEGRVQGDDSVKIGSLEGQTMNADVSVQYSVERTKAAELYTVWAGAPIEKIEDNLVRQVTRGALSDVASQYGWEEIYGAKRPEYIAKVSGIIRQRFTEKAIKFEALNLRAWHLPENLQKALEQKITAQQAAEQQKFALQQAQTKAQQDRVTAEGQANALRAQAQGEADATRIRAVAQSEANKQLSQSLTPDLIRYQQLQRWDGKLPVFSGSGATPLVDVSGLTNPNPTAAPTTAPAK